MTFMAGVRMGQSKYTNKFNNAGVAKWQTHGTYNPILADFFSFLPVA